jgi:ribonuclease BN (tRNA processing enzyme)
MVQDTVWQICDRLHGSLTPKRSLFFLQREVKRLALLDMPFAQSDVCFRGNNGSRAHIVKSTRLTPSGPRHRYRVYNIVRSQFNFLPESCLKNGDVPKYWHLVPSVGTKSFLTLMGRGGHWHPQSAYYAKPAFKLFTVKGAFMIRFGIIFLLFLLSISLNEFSASAQSCSANPVVVQILGSGGPRINPFRSSSSYLLWINGQSRILIDMGGGAHQRFGQSQAKVEDLWMVGVSHLHPDHVSDLPAFLWLSHEVRKEPLKIFGPTGNDAAPDFATFLNRLFDEKTGAFPVLGSALGGSHGGGGVRPDTGRVVAGGVRLDVGVIDAAKTDPSPVLQRDGTTVTAQRIPHGNMPTLAYRVQTGNVSVVFSSDQNGTDPKFVEFAKGANILIMHLAVAPGANNPLHATPAVVGRIAQEAGVARLIVSHIGLFNLDSAIADLRKFYTGPLTVGADMQCNPVQ